MDRRRNLVRGGLLVLAVAACAHASLYRGWVVDDAYISWRYARNWEEGLGPVYNPGERVEGFSNPSWVALTALALRLDLAPEDAALWLGLGSVFVTVLLAGALVRRERPGARWAPWLAGGVLAVLPAFVRHAANGLETSLFAVLVLALAAATGTGPPGRGRGVLLALLALAVVWTRPEGALYAALAAVFGVAAARRRGGGAARRALVPWAAAAAVSLALLAARTAFYGSLVPNTFHAKVTGTVGGLIDGLQYLGAFFRDGSGQLVPVLAVVPLLLGGGQKKTTLLAAFAAAGAVFAVVSGGDWMQHYRFLAPVIPPLAVLAAVGASDLWSRLAGTIPRRRLAAGLLTTGALALLGLLDAERAVWHAAAAGRDEGEDQVRVYAAVGDWLGANLPADALVAASDIGALGYRSDLPVVDMFGLVDAHVARRAGKQHHKVDPAYVLSRDPAAVVLIADACADGVYHRVPDARLAARRGFRDRYELWREFPIPPRREVVQVYRRRDAGAG